MAISWQVYRGYITFSFPNDGFNEAQWDGQCLGIFIYFLNNTTLLLLHNQLHNLTCVERHLALVCACLVKVLTTSGCKLSDILRILAMSYSTS